MNDNKLAITANHIRQGIVTAVYNAKSGHPGGSLSIADIMTYLYFEEMNIDPDDPDKKDRDRFVLSKGHTAPALYSTLANRGFFSVKELESLRHVGSILQGHPDMKHIPGVDMSSGSLGQGTSVAVGLAMGARAAGLDSHVYVIVGDGEIQEGQTWEAAMSAAHFKLDNLTWIVDNNRLQIMGSNDEVMGLGSLEDKYRSFGFEVLSVDGHDYEQLLTALQAGTDGKPKCIVAHTIKGKGVSFMENQVKWHGATLSPEQLDKALEELDAEEAAL